MLPGLAHLLSRPPFQLSACSPKRQESLLSRVATRAAEALQGLQNSRRRAGREGWCPRTRRRSVLQRRHPFPGFQRRVGWRPFLGARSRLTTHQATRNGTATPAMGPRPCCNGLGAIRPRAIGNPLQRQQRQPNEMAQFKVHVRAGNITAQALLWPRNPLAVCRRSPFSQSTPLQIATELANEIKRETRREGSEHRG